MRPMLTPARCYLIALSVLAALLLYTTGGALGIHLAVSHGASTPQAAAEAHESCQGHGQEQEPEQDAPTDHDCETCLMLMGAVKPIALVASGSITAPRPIATDTLSHAPLYLGTQRLRDISRRGPPTAI